jgi:glycosyltransferase involved in cell wall biosynthesis
MRINILQGPFLPVPPLRGGAVGKMWFHLESEFAARGHQVTHVSRLCDGLPAREERHNVQHLRVRGADQSRSLARNLLHDFFYAWRAARVAPDADITITNTFWAPALLGPRHGAIYVDVQRMPKGQLRLYGRAARLRANSSAVREAIVAEAPALATRVRVIPNPLPYASQPAVVWKKKERTMAFVGRLHPEKGIELLLEAWGRGQTSGRLRGWQLELVGPVKTGEGGGGEAWLRALKGRFPLADVVWHEPIYDEAALAGVYERASVFVYPSIAEKGETFGVAVLEAMSWGAVPVVSDLACFRDFVEPGRNGWAFNHRGDDAVSGLCAALERATQTDARAIAERAVGVRKTHSRPAIAERFLADFGEVVGKEHCERAALTKEKE